MAASREELIAVVMKQQWVARSMLFAGGAQLAGADLTSQLKSLMVFTASGSMPIHDWLIYSISSDGDQHLGGSPVRVCSLVQKILTMAANAGGSDAERQPVTRCVRDKKRNARVLSKLRMTIYAIARILRSRTIRNRFSSPLAWMPSSGVIPSPGTGRRSRSNRK
jgi:hypothetical protein